MVVGWVEEARRVAPDELTQGLEDALTSLRDDKAKLASVSAPGVSLRLLPRWSRAWRHSKRGNRAVKASAPKTKPERWSYFLGGFAS